MDEGTANSFAGPTAWLPKTPTFGDAFSKGLAHGMRWKWRIRPGQGHFHSSKARLGGLRFSLRVLAISEAVAEIMVAGKINSDDCPMASVFCAEAERLHLLAWILTGSAQAASECVIDAFREARNSFLASPEFAYDRAKLATIKVALRRVADEIKEHATRDLALTSNHNDGLGAFDLDRISGKHFLAAILDLNAFYRAVLLLRIYENYRNHVAGLLLRLAPAVVERGQVHAIVSLVGQIYSQCKTGVEAVSPEPIKLHSHSCITAQHGHLRLSGGSR